MGFTGVMLSWQLAAGVGGWSPAQCHLPSCRATTWVQRRLPGTTSGEGKEGAQGATCSEAAAATFTTLQCRALPPSSPSPCHCHFCLYSNPLPSGLVPVLATCEHNFFAVSFLWGKRSTPFPQMAPCSKPALWASAPSGHADNSVWTLKEG